MRTASKLTTILTLSLLAPVSLGAQEVRYLSVSRANMPGIFGALVGAFGGGESRTTTYYKGARMRVDNGSETSTIFDLEAGRFVVLMHESRTYEEYDLADMQRALTQLAEQTAQSAGTTPAQDAEADFDVNLRVERTGQRRTIAGSTAEQVYMILETTLTYTSDDQQDAPSGRMVVFVDSWRSTDSPIYRAMQGFQSAELEEFWSGMAPAGNAFMANPSIAAAMKEAEAAAKDLEGAPLLETLSIFIIPEGATFDVAAATRGDDDSGRPSLGEVAGQALGGALGGLFGRGRGAQPPQPAEPAPQQVRLITTTTEVVEVEDRVDDAVFQVPAGYTRVEPADATNR